jgi:hypothetical protein
MIEKTLSLKEEAEKLMKIKGNARGEALRNHFIYIRYKKGEDGISKVEEKMRELGYPLTFKEIKPLEWYPTVLGILIILAAKEVFNWKDSDIFDMGNSAPKYSFIVKLLMKYLLSPKKTFKESPKYWKKYFDFGDLKTVEFNEKEKYLVIRIIGFNLHPITCVFHSGYFLRIMQFVVKSEKTTIEETKCVHKGDPYHEYIIKWQ